MGFGIGDTIDSAVELPGVQTAQVSRAFGFTLESGARFGPINVAYKAFGKLNKAKDNAVLVFPTLTATPQPASENLGKRALQGWWPEIVGQGKPVDTKKFFVVCPDHFGGCYGSTGPASKDPYTGTEYGLRFPGFFIKDMAKVTLGFLGKIGLHRLKAIVGASIGGLLTLQTVALQRNFAEKAIVLGASHKVSAHYLALNHIARQAIMLDPCWSFGRYHGKSFPEKGLSIARQIGHISYLNQLVLDQKFGRKPLGKFKDHVSLGLQYQVESYLDHQGKKFCKRFDPNSYIYLSKAIDTFDLEKDFGSIENAFSGSSTAFSFLSINSDQLFLPADTISLHKQLLAAGVKSSFNKILSPKGHDGLFLESKQIAPVIGKALKS